MAFYADMANMARELLLPDSQGGLGQGVVTVVRVVQNPRPDDWPAWQPWDDAETQETYLLRAAVSGVAEKYVDGVTILATDQMLICADYMELAGAVVPFDMEVGDVINVDGKPLTTIRRIDIPGAGVKAAHKFVVRG